MLPDRKRAVDKKELKLAIDLIERMKGTFDHSAYHDRYRERLMAIIDKKRKGETITAPEVEERKAPSDLLAALEASLGEAVEPPQDASSGRAASGASRTQARRAARKRPPKAGVQPESPPSDRRSKSAAASRARGAAAVRDRDREPPSALLRRRSEHRRDAATHSEGGRMPRMRAT